MKASRAERSGVGVSAMAVLPGEAERMGRSAVKEKKNDTSDLNSLCFYGLFILQMQDLTK